MNIYDCLYAAMMLSGCNRTEARVEATHIVKTETAYMVIRKPTGKKNS